MKRILNSKKLQKFELYLRNEEKSEATLQKYMRDVRRFASYAGLDGISKERVLEYKARLAERYTPTSANSMIAAINAFFRFCGWHELCIKQFKIQREAYCSAEKELTREEYIRLVNAAKDGNNERLSLIIQTICGTGIRVSELQYVTVDALHAGEAFVRCKGKNRRIFIIPELKKKLLRYAREQKIGSGAVFVTRTGKPVSRHNVWRDMKALCKEAEVSPTKVFPHNLRHLFARTFYGIEKDIAKLADILGHSSINTTMIYIATTAVEHKRKMANMRLII